MRFRLQNCITVNPLLSLPGGAYFFRALLRGGGGGGGLNSVMRMRIIFSLTVMQFQTFLELSYNL